MQTKKMSAVEVTTNYIIGFTISWLSVFYIFPLWGLKQEISTATEITIFFTVISVLRSYILRRVFNYINFWN